MGGWGNFQDEHEPGTVGMEEAIGVKIEFQKYPTDADFWNNLPAQIAAKTAPDFISLTNELYLPYINDGLVVPLTSYVEDGTISCWDSIAQNLKDIWEIDGEIYGIPTHQSPAVFAINMNLWNEAGLTEDDFPETWDDVLEFPGKKVIFVCLMLSMMIPGQLVLLPQYIMMAQMGLVDTLAAIIIPYLSQSMFIFMARQFFYGIPEELEEAARIDGLGRFGTYVRIVLPISGVLIATIAIFNFTGTWNSYLVPSTFISTLEKFVLVVGLQTVNNEHFQQENLTLAGVFLLSFPVIIFFMFTQKFFVQGIATSGIKS